MKSCIALIPARGGSKRLPGKNTRNLGELPLIVHSIKYAQAQPQIQEVYVSTDDATIAAIAKEYGAVVIQRPESLAGDNQPTVSALKHAVEEIGFEGYVVLLQATNPLRPESLFQDAWDAMIRSQAQSLFTVSRSYYKLGKIQNNQFIPFNYQPGQRSQDLEPLYFENGLLYISHSDRIRRDLIMDSDSIPFHIDHPFAQVDIDTLEDFEYAQYLYQVYSKGE